MRGVAAVVIAGLLAGADAGLAADPPAPAQRGPSLLLAVGPGLVAQAQGPGSREYTVELEDVDGAVQVLSGFAACGELFFVRGAGQAASSGLGIYGYTQHHQSGTTRVLRYFSIPFDSIREVRVTNAGDRGELRWRVRLESGESRLITVDSATTAYCGTTADGVEMQFRAARVRSIAFR